MNNQRMNSPWAASAITTRCSHISHNNKVLPEYPSWALEAAAITIPDQMCDATSLYPLRTVRRHLIIIAIPTKADK